MAEEHVTPLESLTAKVGQQLLLIQESMILNNYKLLMV
jgi:hypothetical protein